MARPQNLLTDKSAKAALKVAGKYTDGNGLFLVVKPATGAKATGKFNGYWTFIYRSPVHRSVRAAKVADKATGEMTLVAQAVGQTREMGLGLFGDGTSGTVTLSEARKKAADARDLMKDDKDPLDERIRAAKPVKTIPTFGEVADALIVSMEASWRNNKHREQWKMTLREYAAPLRVKPVDEIAVADVLECLKPHWEQRPETADRLRGRIERVLNAAKAQGFRTGENPAAWRGHLENLLPRRQKLARGHHGAMPYTEVPAFVAKLRLREGIAALCLEWTILSAARSGEARGALWCEIDAATRVWTIPAARMKAANEHRVPLTPRMLEILAIVKPLRRDDDLLFPGMREGARLSDMTLAAVLKRMKIENATPHGFRSAFRHWCGSATSYPRELAEEALAHVIGSKVERAYRRQDALERRRELMTAWERFCTTPAGVNVLPLRKSTG